MISKKDEVTPSAGVRINHKGNFNLDVLYKKSKTFFDSRKYDFTEKEHTEKNKSYGNELKVIWLAEREVDDYVKFNIEATFEVWDIIKKNNNYTGDLKINVKAWLDLDYKNNFHKFPFLLFIYNNFIIKKKIEKIYEDKIYSELLEFTDLIKDILKMLK